MTPEVIVVDEDFRPEEVLAFWDFMMARYRTTAVDKRGAGEMRAVGTLLGELGVLNTREFLESYSTTIRRTLYLPFQPGAFEGRFGGLEQIILCVHEHTHVAQYDAEGWKYELKYLLDSEARASYEAQAYRTTQIIETWRFGAPRAKPQDLASHLSAYACSPADIAFAERYLALSAPSIAAGAIPDAVAQVAVAWLDAHVPRLRADPATSP